MAEAHTRFKIDAVRSKLKLGSFETVPLRVRRLSSNSGGWFLSLLVRATTLLLGYDHAARRRRRGGGVRARQPHTRCSSSAVRLRLDDMATSQILVWARIHPLGQKPSEKY